jgi:phosphohistidine phosphatase
MILYIIRHAIAESAAAGSSPEEDSRRALTPKGRKRMREIARGLSHLTAPPEVILTSPYVRAMQTARILADALDLGKGQLTVTEDLAPAGDMRRVIDQIAGDFGSARAAALVGHEPSLSHLISVLMSGEPSLSIALRKGGVCKISVEKLAYGRCAVLECLMAPAQLRRIGA